MHEQQNSPLTMHLHSYVGVISHEAQMYTYLRTGQALCISTSLCTGTSTFSSPSPRDNCGALLRQRQADATRIFFVPTLPLLACEQR